MNEREHLTIERVDDIPILLAQLEHMQVASLLDRYFPRHGNWQGLSLGQGVEVWVSHILSEGDDWLNHKVKKPGIWDPLSIDFSQDILDWHGLYMLMRSACATLSASPGVLSQ